MDQNLLHHSSNEEKDAAYNSLEPGDRLRLIQSIAQVTPDILFVLDLYTKELLYRNRPVEAILGFTKKEASLFSEPFYELLHPDDLPKLLAHIEEMKSARLNEVRQHNYRMIAADGSIRSFRDHCTVCKVNAEGNAVEKTGIMHDITDSVAAEEKIMELNRILTEKNHALESANSEIRTFNSVASTDYKETLQNLYTNLEFIVTRDAANLSDAGKGNLRKMQSAIQKMKLLTDDIISFSQIDTLDNVLTNVDLNRILRIALKDLDGKLAEGEVKIEAEALPSIPGFPLLLVRLFNHLLDNAIKFHVDPAHPEVKILYEANVLRPGAGAAEQLYNKIIFKDNGIGFEEKESGKIFTMFYRVKSGVKFKGSGIGLAIAKKIMDIHHGFITAESNEKGASFSCWFPAS